MIWEVIAAVLVGAAAMWLVLVPLVRPAAVRPLALEPEDPLETRRGQALLALKELEYDRAMDKLSDQDYEALRATYTAEALAALRDEEGAPAAAAADGLPEPMDAAEALIADRARRRTAGTTSSRGETLAACPRCGPRPETDARFCSSCGAGLGSAECRGCGATLRPDGRYCDRCGAAAAA